MRLAFTWQGWLTTASGVTLLVTGCNASLNHRLLTVFFTGVDQPSAPEKVQPAASLETNVVLPRPVLVVEPQPILHKPFAERKCSACHLGEQSEELRAKERELCVECHRKLLQTDKITHPLVTEGKCQPCHVSHKSAERYLLPRPAQALCQNCHPPSKIAEVKGHATIETEACLGCHDPHRAERSKLLKAGT